MSLRFQIFLCDDAKNMSRLLRSALFLGLALSVHTGVLPGHQFVTFIVFLPVPMLMYHVSLWGLSFVGGLFSAQEYLNLQANPTQ